VTSAIVGARRTGQIAETVKAGDWQLNEEELTSIEAAYSEFLSVVQA
jgi:aryl-alcohol dehydrogenase-like predicted oxidoreductase